MSLSAFTDYLKDRRLAESTTETKVRLIHHLSRNCNLWDSQAVSDYISGKSWQGRRKNKARARMIKEDIEQAGKLLGWII